MSRLTVRDRFNLVKVGDPQISPDGKWIAFTHETSDFDQDSTESSIWVVQADGSGQPRRLTPTGSSSQMPRWSPDGKQIAFLSDRDGDEGKPKLYLLDITEGGGEAQPIETEHTPSSAPVWSPDGEKIAFSAWVDAEGEDELTYPGAPSRSDKDCDDDSDSQGDKPVVMTTLAGRLDGFGFFNGRTQHIFTVEAAAGGEAQVNRVTDGPYFHSSPAWSPDGRWIACTASRDKPHSDMPFDRRLWIFSADDEDSYPVLDVDYPAYSPAWSPDGSRIAFYGQPQEFNWLSTPNQLFVIELDGQRPQGWDAVSCPSEELDRNVGMAAGSDTRKAGESFAPPLWLDGDSLAAPVASEGQSHLYRFCTADGEPRRLTEAGRRAVADPSFAAGRFAFVASEPTRPDQIFVMQDDGGQQRVLTDFNCDVVKDWTLIQPEVLNYTSCDGWQVQGWMLRAHGSEAGETRPTVLLVHGGPSGMYGEGFSFTNQLLASRGYHVLFTNPRGSSGYGAEFQQAVVGDWGGRDFADIMAGVDLLISRGEAEEGSIGITGWSYGGFMTNWAVTQTDRFSAAVSGASVSNQRSMFGCSDVGYSFTSYSVQSVPWESDEAMVRHSPIRHVQNVETPVLFLHGENDLRCPIGQSDEMYTSLLKLGQTAVMVRYPSEPHGFSRPHNIEDRWQRTLAWFDHYLK